MRSASLADEPTPQDADPPEASPRTPSTELPPTSGTDDAQLTGLLGVIFSPWTPGNQRAEAVEMANMRTARAVAPLAYLLQEDPDPSVRVAAAHMLGRMPAQPEDPRITQALLASARLRIEAKAVRVAAIQALRWVGPDETGEDLRALYASEDEPAQVRAAAREALAARWPSLLERTPAVVDRSGRSTLILGGVALGSYTLGAVGALGKNNAGISIGIVGGAVTGGVTASYLTRSGEITQAQATWMTSAGAWGAGIGMSTAAAIQADPDHRFVLSLGLLGETAAFTAATLTRKTMRYTAEDVGEVNGGGLLAMNLALGALLLDWPEDERITYGVLAGASTLGLGTGLALARHVQFSDQDKGLLALGLYEGAWLGAVTPHALAEHPTDNQAGAGPLLGASLGIVAAGAVAQSTELSSKQLGLVWLFGSYGKLLGYSVPLLTRDTAGTGDARGVFIGSVAGDAAGALLAGRLQFHGGGASLVALGTVVGGWHGLGLGIGANVEGRELGGLACAGTAVGGLGSIALAQRLRLSNSDVQALAGGLFWGTWFSAWGSALSDLDEESAIRLVVYSGDAGMAIGGLLVSPAVNIDPRRIGVAYLGGLSGAAIVSLGAALVTRDNDTLIKANLVGSGAGLLAGALVAQQITFSSTQTTPRAPLSLGTPVLTPIVLAAPPGQLPSIGVGATFIEMP